MNKRKVLALVLSLVLILTCAVAGVLAWLSAKSDPVTNTFAPSTIGLTLDESKYKAETNELLSDRVQANENYKMVPGWVLPKDPKVTVAANSVDCYVFLKVTKSNDPDTYLTYAIDSGWTSLTDVTDVYYREVTGSNSDQGFAVLADNKVTVKNTLTQTELGELTSEKYPELEFTSYAVQMYKDYNVKFTPAEAWAEAQNLG